MADTGWIFINHRGFWDYFRDPNDETFICRQFIAYVENERVVSSTVEDNFLSTALVDVNIEVGQVRLAKSLDFGRVPSSEIVTGQTLFAGIDLPKSPSGDEFLGAILDEFTTDNDYIAKNGAITIRRTYRVFSDVEKTDSETTSAWQWAGYGTPRGGTYITP